MTGATERLLGVARALWRASPKRLREALGLAVGAGLRDSLAARVKAQLWAPGPPGPIVISAFFSGATGVAAAGRASADALEEAGFQVIRHDLGPLLDAGGFQAHELPGERDGVWLIHANPPEAKLALARLRRVGWEGRYRIGYWAWELPAAPADWLRTAAAFHEVWAPSAFVRDALTGAPTRLVLRPHPPPKVSDVQPDRASFGLPEGAAVFLTMADLASGLRRKNPLGVVRAYALAFPKPRPDRRLLVKLHSVSADPSARAELHAATAARGDIHVIDSRLSPKEALALIASADVLVSLHRSEGFGLPIAEAFALGRAVIATGWSGSETLLARNESARIPFTLVSATDPGGPYDAPGQTWAEPDLVAAAGRMKALADDPDLRALVASQGRAAVARLADAWSLAVLDAEPWAQGVARRTPITGAPT